MDRNRRQEHTMSTQGLPFPLGHVVTEIPGRGGIVAPGVAPCHRCDAPATTQWPRTATDAEAEQHWTALEQHIRAQPDIAGHGNATWTADRTDAVVKAVHACDQHVVDAPHLTHQAECGGHGACHCNHPSSEHGD
jgi:hypothetical protein